MRKRKITKKLKELGTTSEEVAHSLKNLGVTGTPNLAWSCPIAHYLCLKTEGRVWSVNSKSSYCGKRYPNPPAVTQFILEFDDGKWRELRDE